VADASSERSGPAMPGFLFLFLGRSHWTEESHPSCKEMWHVSMAKKHRLFMTDFINLNIKSI
jgi:hypothetical protein